jgi:DNA processing protein
MNRFEGFFTDRLGNTARRSFALNRPLAVGDEVRAGEIGLSSPVEIWEVTHLEDGGRTGLAVPWPKEEPLSPAARDRDGKSSPGGRSPSVEELGALYALESIKGFGPEKFKQLFMAGVTPQTVLEDPELLPISGTRGQTFREALSSLGRSATSPFRDRAARQLERAGELDAHLLTYAHPSYPRAVLDSNNPVPVIYARGSLDVIADDLAVACVGSRGVEGRYAKRHADFARVATNAGFVVVSGFALGADRIGHEAAWKAGGRTVCVMPCGVDLPFPPENRALWKELLDYKGAAFVSEFAFGMKARALTLRKRNKLIVAFARGVFLSQTAEKGGAMNAYRFAGEQRKPVATLEPNGSSATSGNGLIGSDDSGRSTTIPFDNFDAASKAWLRQLSSST